MRNFPGVDKRRPHHFGPHELKGNAPSWSIIGKRAPLL
jgi:hypothetical protein